MQRVVRGVESRSGESQEREIGRTRPGLAGSLLALGVLFSLGAGPASATPLGLVLEQFPDVLVGNMDVSYDAATDTLSLDGFALELDDDGVGTALPITSGSFDLVATIDGAGNLSAGSLTIGGTVPDIGANSGTLLIGTLDSFGFPDAGGDPIELTFSITGGDLAPLYGAGPGGIIVGDSGFGGSFASDWDNLIASTPGTGFGVADVAPVPEPGTLSLLGASLAGIAWLGRRRGPATAA